MYNFIFAILLFVPLSYEQGVIPYGFNRQYDYSNRNAGIGNNLQLVRKDLPGGTIYYSLGFRVSGDTLVGHSVNNFKYPNLQNVKQSIWYPTSGVGKIVSFVEIWVDQTSKIGNAFVVNGGVGQRYISILLEAKQTRAFNYRAAIYAY